MDYELSKELKEVGFPQEYDVCDGGYVVPPDININGIINEDKTDTDKMCYAPTLDELIEACGEEFYTLNKLLLAGGELVWRAHAFRENVSGSITGQGKTPSIAVARLYIALNKKYE